METAALGRWAEQEAVKFLSARGYDVIKSNYRKPWGEIDIIASKDGVLIFVEVKASQHNATGFEPELRADWRKQKKIIRTARTYLAERKLPDAQEWQIDIISVMLNRQTLSAKITHFKNI
ncbi:MAG: YraN family protein [Patescibacteria group bacterium]